MLFRLSQDTPRFEVFRLLNVELIHFIKKSVAGGKFQRGLFSPGAVGKACWENSRTKSPKAKNDLTREKFEDLFDALVAADGDVRNRLFKTIQDHQNLQSFFKSPNPALLEFLPEPCMKALRSLAAHLYSSTKDIKSIIIEAGGIDIAAHFNTFRRETVNGNICKACGMKELAAFRAGIPDGDQWRADYDHQLCKSKYPIFAVHPDNLIPLCDVCNQDAKKAKDLFRDENGKGRLAFCPYTEEARDLVEIDISRLRDPEPIIKVRWLENDVDLVNKLETWDDIYEIRRRVEGRFRSLEAVIEDEISPTDLADLEEQIARKAKDISEATLMRKEWAFWHQKLFSQLNQVDLAPFWKRLQFVAEQGRTGGEYILNGA